MKSSLFVRIFAVFVLVGASYVAAQDSQLTNITGGGAKGAIPVFTGTHKIGNSKITQDASGNENFAAGINAAGIISGSSDIDAGGNVNVSNSVNASGNVSASGYVFSDSYLDTAGTVYGAEASFSGPGFFEPSSGQAVIAITGNGSQEIQGEQFAQPANSAFEYAYFDWNLNPVIWGDSLGDTVAIGSKSAAVPLKNGKMVRVYSQESPQVWFEDFGSASLVGGVATVKLESKYAQLVNTKMPYHVVVTPNGDCHGLYVARKDQNTFEVRELGGGQSNVEFDYRISALRNGFEKVRLEPAKVPSAAAPKRPIAPKR